MPRKPLIFAAIVIALHLIEAATLGTSTNGSFLANLLEIVACGFAAVMAFGASRRGRGLSRPFWLLVGLGISMWGLANLGWMYYEVGLHSEPPQASVVRFLFGFEAVLIALALFLDQDKDSPRIGVETALDFVQIGIVFFFIFLEFYFLPARQMDAHSAFLREMRVENLEDVMVVALAGFRALTAGKQHLRKLYRGLTLYYLVVAVFAAVAQYLQSVQPTPTGTPRDLLWTLPFLTGALWAAQWKPDASEGSISPARHKTLGELLITNGTLALAPLIILFEVSQFQAEWRLLRFSLLGVSIVCYAARLGLSQYREAKSASEVQTHVHQFFVPDAQDEVNRLCAEAPGLLQPISHIAGQAISIRLHGLEVARVSMEGTAYPLGQPLSGIIQELSELRRYGSRHLLARTHEERWLESNVIGNICQILPFVDARHIYPQVPSFIGEERNIIDLLTITREGRLVIIEIKVSADPDLPFQALDYWIAVERHRKAGDFVNKGYFAGCNLRDEPALLVLVAPLLAYHKTSRMLTGLLQPELPLLQIGINQAWKKEIKILRRQGMVS